MALFGRFFGRAAAEGAGFAFGRASAPVLSPALEEIRQEAWKVYATRIPDAAGLAAGVAEGKVNESTAREWAERHGFGETSFDALVAMATAAPDVGTAMQAWRRRELTTPQFEKVLKRHGIAAEWTDAIEALRDSLLSPGELAAAIHRGLVPDPGLLQGEQPTPPFKVDAYPVYPIDAVQEAAGSGYDRDRLGVLVGLQGLPMGPHEAAQALFRGIITHGDYIRAFNESNNRNEWAQAVLEQSRQIPTARDFLENALRGYRTLPEALAGAERHGMSEADATMIYQNQGRPMNIRQITQALARGAKFNPEPGEITDPYRASTVEGPLKPAYYELNEALKYVMPSTFAIRQLVQSGVWSAAKGAERLKWSGWFPQDADEVAAAWAETDTGTTINPRVKRAQDQVYNATHKSYMDNELDRAQAIGFLERIGLSAAVAGQVVDVWEIENEAAIKPLTPAAIKKAYKANDFTIDEAVSRLVDQQWTAADANTYLTT